jgi:hypothetical protein
VTHRALWEIARQPVLEEAREALAASWESLPEAFRPGEQMFGRQWRRAPADRAAPEALLAHQCRIGELGVPAEPEGAACGNARGALTAGPRILGRPR